MKCIFLFILLLFSYHLNAQATEKQTKDIRTIRVHPVPKSITQSSIAIEPEDSIPIIPRTAQRMPMFSDTSCITLTSYIERKACADQKLLSFIYNKLNYPNSLRDAGLEAKVVISFIVNTDGSLQNFKILKGKDNPAFAEEFIRAIKLTTEENGPWIPAMQNGQNVPLKVHLPCRLCFR